RWRARSASSSVPAARRPRINSDRQVSIRGSRSGSRAIQRVQRVQIHLQPFLKSLFFRSSLKELEGVGVGGLSFCGVLHFQDDTVKQVCQVENDFVVVLMPLRTHFQQGTKQEAVK